MPRPALLLALFIALAGTGCQTLYFATLNRGAPAASSERYGALPAQTLDVYRPAGNASPAPVLVFFYGGRWQTGRRADYAFVGRMLAERGVLTVVADYRHWPAVGFPGFVEDAAAAVAWTHRRAAALGGDPQRLFVAGHSAGAHLAALLGTDARYLRAHGLAPRQLAGVIGIAGPYDFLPLTDPDLQALFGPEARWPESQPVAFVDGDEPPFLLLHGRDDRLVWTRNSERLAAALRRHDVPVRLAIYPGLGHVRILGGLRYRALAPTLGDVLGFVGVASGE